MTKQATLFMIAQCMANNSHNDSAKIYRSRYRAILHVYRKVHKNRPRIYLPFLVVTKTFDIPIHDHVFELTELIDHRCCNDDLNNLLGPDFW